MTVGPSADDAPRAARRLPGLARRLAHVSVWEAIARSRIRASERALPATRHLSAQGAGTGAGAGVARERMREFLRRADGRGVTITMIVNQLASEQLKVARSMVRRWLADDIARGVVERVTLGFYRLRQSGDAGRRGSSE